MVVGLDCSFDAKALFDTTQLLDPSYSGLHTLALVFIIYFRHGADINEGHCTSILQYW